MKKIFIKLLVFAMSFIMTVTSVSAEKWINLSSWSYSDVSAFVSAGLLPESFEDVSDFKADITRIQFCDLVESVVKKTKSNLSEYIDDSSVFLDLQDSSSASFLLRYGIIEGYKPDKEYLNQVGNIVINSSNYGKLVFKPNEKITREDAAAIVYRTEKVFGSALVDNKSEEYKKQDISAMYSDSDVISEYAIEAVKYLNGMGIVTDMENGMFCPKSNITIEQAITMVYRMYNTFPKKVSSDYEGIVNDGTEKQLKTFDGGLIETYDDNMLYIKDSENILLSLEADVYSIVNCVEYNGVRMAFAVNFNDKTDVYNIDTKELMYTIPYITESIDVDNGYVNVISSRWYPVLYGMYKIDGTEIIKPQYSQMEIREIVNNNFTVPEDEYREADGTIYYCDLSDGGNLYKVDTNGDNRMKLSNYNCYKPNYHNGKVIYSAKEDSSLHIVNNDGTEEKTILNSLALQFVPVKPAVFEVKKIESSDGNIRTDMYGLYITDKNADYSNEGYIFAASSLNDVLYAIDIKEETPTAVKIDEGKFIRQVSGGGYIYYLKLFTNELCRSDGHTAENIAPGYMVSQFAFAPADNEKGYNTDKLRFSVQDDDSCYYEIDLTTGDIEKFELTEDDFVFEEYSSLIEKYSDENYKVYTEYGKVTGAYNEYGNIVYNMNTETYITDDEENKILTLEGGVYERLGNIIFISEYKSPSNWIKNGTTLNAIDLETGEKYNVINEVDCVRAKNKDNGWIAFQDNNSVVMRYSLENGIQEVFPCKGIHKYGEVLSIDRSNIENILYKIDTNGDFYKLTDGGVGDFQYVPNSMK